jgi:tRNA G18 (ribose-2'-O)-methylase SpoU
LNNRLNVGSTIAIDSLHDPRISPYRALKDRDVAKHGNLFIAEGEHIVRRLLASDFPTVSVLLDEKRVEEFAPTVPQSVPVYAAPTSLMTQIIGFRFHSGIIACGKRKPPLALPDILSAFSPRPQGGASSARLARPLVLVPDLNNAENLGGIIRLCAGFGAAALILGPLSVDPFWRQSIRVSMGTVFSLPILRSTDIIQDIRYLREHQITTFAAVLDETAESLDSITRPPRSALLFGSEAHGLSQDMISACDRRITLPMQLGTDSLNVAVCAGICLYHFTRLRPI